MAQYAGMCNGGLPEDGYRAVSQDATTSNAIHVVRWSTKSITYENILSQSNLDAIKHRRLVQALALVFKSYPNYISDMFGIKTVHTVSVELLADLINRPLILVLSTNLSLMLLANTGTTNLFISGGP